MKIKLTFSLICIAMVLAPPFIMLNNAHAVTIPLWDIDSKNTLPPGNYRWLDVADQAYSDYYLNTYNYAQETVSVYVTYEVIGNALRGTLTAVNLKPNFAYQLKIAGNPDIDADTNEKIGLAGRWWEEEWDGATWTNGRNLNNKGDGSSPNPNDNIYFARRDVSDETSPTGLHYRYTGYLVFDYFITDEDGNAIFEFETNSSFHVLWKTTQRDWTDSDGPQKTTTFDVDPLLSPAYDTDYGEKTVRIFGEWERLPVGGIFLQPGDYVAEIILTEESFHGSGGPYPGNWAAAMSAPINFSIVTNDAPVANDDTASTTKDTPVTIDVLSNDTDVDGDTLSVSAVTQTSHGTVTNNGTDVTYSPEINYSGPDSFTYTASDGHAESSPATVAVTVTNVNNAPQFTSTSVTAATEDVAYTYNVTTSDPDAGDTLTITAPTLPSWLTLTDSGNGTASLSGTPSNSEVGDHPVGLQVMDAGGLFATQSFTINVTAGVMNDVVTITTALYKSKPHQLLIEATSSAQPNAVLSIDVDGMDYGVMTFDEGNSKYVFRGKISDPVETVVVTSNFGGSDTVNLGESSNIPPVADTGGDYQITDSDSNGTEIVTLNGSGSFDPDGSIQGYEWKEGGEVLGNAATLKFNFSLGTHFVTLIVTDNQGATASDNAVVNVIPMGGPDLVTILRAEYTRKTKQLLVEATSNQQPGAVLTLEGYGSMTFSGGDSTYIFNSKVRNLKQGVAVEVTSNYGGLDTALVDFK
jgi:hypothetical protein